MATPFEHLQTTLKNGLAIYKAPAMMAAIVRNHDFSVAAVRGVRKADVSATDENNKVKANDRFCLGSVSKPVSGYLLAYLSQLNDNTIDWDIRIRDAFPELESAACRKHYNIRSSYLNANIAQMMSHSAGFPYAPKNSMDYAIDLAELKTTVNSDYQVEYCNHAALMQRRYNYMISSQQDAPVTGYVYNGGPILPAAMAERVMGKSFEQLLEQYLFLPLEMTTAGTGRTATSGTPDGIWEHSWDATSKKFLPSEKRMHKTASFHSHGPAGGIHFSADDAIKFIKALFINNKTKKLVQNAKLEEMYLTYMYDFSKYGWISTGTGNDLRVSHNGDNGTCRCQLTVWPNRGEGYIVCTNCNGNDAAGDLTNCVNRNSNGNTIGANIGCKTVDHVCDEIDNMLTNWTTMFS